MSPTRRAKSAGMCRAMVWPCILVAAGCGAPLDVLSPASDATDRVAGLGWFMIITAAIVYAIVMAAMVLALRRHRQRDAIAVDLSDPGVRGIVIGGIILPGLVLGAIFAVAETALGRYPDPRPSLTIRVTGHQWWWEVEYLMPDPTQHFKTANEIHIPVGTPVRLVLTSADVIHSFWVPRLQGKIDLIPGDTNEVRLMARTPDEYRGQCQEFCGAQHAHMGMRVVADDSATFARWLGNQLADAKQPIDSFLLAGQQAFVGGACALCHTVRGTPALARVGPDLTHVGSRATIGAETVPNNLGTLEAWIANAPALKPGTKMPTMQGMLDTRQLGAVARYLASLK
jgi:cytochrome c oxidase subunit 2